MSGLKSFVVKFMIRMSRDFATSSLQGEVARENLENIEIDGEEEENLEQYQIAGRRQWEIKLVYGSLCLKIKMNILVHFIL